MKRSRKPSKQLKLAAETVRQLTTRALDDVRGGQGGNYTGACAKQSNNCFPDQTSK